MGLSLQYVYTCVSAFVCVHLFLFCKEEKAASAGAKNRKGFKMRLRCKGGNSSEGHFLLLLFHIGSGFWISSARLPRLRMGRGVLWAGRTGTRSSLLGCWLTGREDRAWDCAVGLAAAGCRERWARVAMAHSASHFRASGSWHRMLWPENLTAQECCARVSSSYAHLAGRGLRVLALQM